MAITTQIRTFLTRPTFTIRELSRVIGLLDATASVVHLGQWRVRPFHWYRRLRWSATTNNYEFRLALDRSFPIQELLWWTKPQNLIAGVPLHEPQPQATMMTDASTRLGSTYGRPSSLGDLVTPSTRRTYQCPGVDGGSTGSTIFPTPPFQHDSSGSGRQHYRLSLPEKRGWGHTPVAFTT